METSYHGDLFLISVTPQPMYVNMNELATLAVQKQKETVERHRLRQLVSEPADTAEHHARTIHQPDPQRRCQRSASLPAKVGGATGVIVKSMA